MNFHTLASKDKKINTANRIGINLSQIIILPTLIYKPAPNLSTCHLDYKQISAN